jgi:hypothetical protein
MTTAPTTAREALLYAESEADFQSWVVDYARIRGWLCAHLRDSRRQDAVGLPDLILARNGLVILAELKSMTGAVKDKQKPWLAASGNHLWRPCDRAAVEAVLL